MSKGYITKINGAYRITGTRVSLDSVVYAWHKGLSPESILDDFPALTLERIYGAVAFYLANQDEIDEYLRQGEVEYEALRQKHLEQLMATKPQLYQKLVTHKQRKRTPTPASE
jgi:uncharacterized protein (DUF433 family)